MAVDLEPLRDWPARAVEAVERTLEAVEARAELNAFITLAPERARETARAVDNAVDGKQGASTSRDRVSMAGWTVGVKDLIDSAGMVTSAGSSRNAVARSDAVVLRNLRNAGAVPIGSTNMDEWGLGVKGRNEAWGDCLNPWRRDRLAGGSSSGSAVAVAAGITRVGLGTDTAGSLRIPASFCGVSALKPSHARLEMSGILGLSPTLDTVGPIARTAADCGAAFAAMAGLRATEAPGERLLRIGVARGAHWQTVEVEVGRGIDAAARRLERAGHRVLDVDVPAIADATRLAGVVLLYELVHRHGNRWSKHASHVGRHVTRQLEKGAATPRKEYAAALRFRDGWLAQLAEAFEKVDVILQATTASVAPPATENVTTSQLTRLCAAWNLAGLPVLAMPCGAGEDGMPIGASFVGPAGAEWMLLGLGMTYQRLTDWHLRTPGADGSQKHEQLEDQR